MFAICAPLNMSGNYHQPCCNTILSLLFTWACQNPLWYYKLVRAACMCCHAEKFPLVSMGAERRVKRVQTRERGHPSAPAEILPILPAFQALPALPNVFPTLGN